MYGLERQINRPQFLIFIISFVSQDYSLLLWWWDGNMDYRRPMKPFFHLKSQTFGLGQTIWVDKF